MKWSFSLILSFVLSLSASAQFPDTVWTRLPPAGGIMSLEPTADGGYVAAAVDWADLAATFAHVLRFDSAGNVLWNARAPGIKSTASSVAELPDGNFLAAGSFGRFWPAATWMMWMKINADGDTLWTRIWPDSLDQVNVSANDVVCLSDGGFALAATAPYTLVRLDSAGQVLWWRDFGGDGQAVVRNPDGGFIVTVNKVPTRLTVLRTDSLGDSLASLNCGTATWGQTIEERPGGWIVGGNVYSNLFIMSVEADCDSGWMFRWPVSSCGLAAFPLPGGAAVGVG